MRSVAAVWAAERIPAAPAATDDTVPPLRRVLPDPSAPAGAVSPAPGPSVRGASGFFWHAQARPAAEPSSTTRYLCAAAYVEPGFASKVIRQVLAPHRAVVPSAGFDLGPVLRHCLTARKLALVRDMLLVVVAVLGLLIATVPFAGVLIIAFLPGALMPLARRPAGKLPAVLTGTAVVAVVVVLLVIAAVRHLVPVLFPVSPWLAGVIFACLLAAVQFGYQILAFLILSRELRPGLPPDPNRHRSRSDEPADARIRAIEAAQWGNVTLYAGEDPFVGAGSFGRAHWLITIELDRGQGGNERRVDPVELQQAIRGRVLTLADPAWPAGERTPTLTVTDHVTGPGVLPWASPLIDSVSQAPYSQAGGQAIEALIRHPRARLRYFQRISAGDDGQPVFSAGQPVVDGREPSVTLSAFVHVAVEGRLLSLEFVRTALPPVRPDYRLPDLLPAPSAPGFYLRALAATARTLLTATVRAPAAIVETERLIWRDYLKTRRAVARYPAEADFGATLSVRELGAADAIGSYLSQLDVDKYGQIIERLVLDAVLEYLTARNVDTAAFAEQAGKL